MTVSVSTAEPKDKNNSVQSTMFYNLLGDKIMLVYINVYIF